LRSRAAVSSARAAASAAARSAPAGLGDRRLGGRLSELARRQVVAQVARGDVDHVATLAELLDVTEEDGLGH
jgi:hypothetical protein